MANGSYRHPASATSGNQLKLTRFQFSVDGSLTTLKHCCGTGNRHCFHGGHLPFEVGELGEVRGLRHTASSSSNTPASHAVTLHPKTPSQNTKGRHFWRPWFFLGTDRTSIETPTASSSTFKYSEASDDLRVTDVSLQHWIPHSHSIVEGGLFDTSYRNAPIPSILRSDSANLVLVNGDRRAY